MWLRWTLAAAAVPIAIFANGSRVAGTGIASHFVGPAAAEGFLHTFSGWMVFVVAGVLLFLVYQLAIWLVPAARSASGGGGAPVERLDPAPATPGARAGLDWRLLAVTGCLVVTGVALGTVTRTEATALREPLSTLPASAGGWELIQDSPLDDKVLAVLAVDEYVNRAYKAPGRPWVSLYVGYYKSQRQGQTMHSPLNCMPGAGWEPVERARVAVPAQAGAASPHAGAEINRLVIQKGVDRQLVLYWYQAHGRIVASEYWGKIYTVVDAIRMNRSDGSMVRVIVPLPSQDLSAEAAAEQAALDFVRAILPDLSKRLDR
jgi:EpsI family protein